MSGPIGVPSSPVLRGLAAAIPDFCIALFFLAAWLEPFRFGAGVIHALLLTMILEFIIVHSSGFMGVVSLTSGRPSRKLLSLFGLGLLYTLFVGAFCLSEGVLWPLISFWALTANRMLVLLNPRPEDTPALYLGASWAMSVVFYIGACILTLMAPVPEFGLAGYSPGDFGLSGGGTWIEEPHRVVAFGVVYFTLQGIWDLVIPLLLERIATARTEVRDQVAPRA
jgi:hypothetical protein